MNIAFISNSHEACGVGQFGRLMSDAMCRFSSHSIYNFFIKDHQELISVKEKVLESDIIVVNYHPETIPFFNGSYLPQIKHIPVIGVIHEWNYTSFNLYSEDANKFHYRIHLDPTLVSAVPNVFSSLRIVPDVKVDLAHNETLTIGIAGFATTPKDYSQIIDRVFKSFQKAIVRFHIPMGEFVDNRLFTGFRENLLKITPPSIKLEFSHEFLSVEQLVNEFLSKNDMNICSYIKQHASGGIASAPDLYIAAERPIAFSTSNMFRHIKFYAPELFWDDNDLDSILAHGSSKVRQLKDMWTPQKAANRYDEIFNQVFEDWKKPQTARFNTILNDTMRKHYDDDINEISKLCPLEFSRKIPEANIQQAFVKSVVEKFAKPKSRILAVGCHEDTAFFSLEQKGFSVEGIDPLINRSLDEHFKYWNNTKPYDVIFSTSVIEHVENDTLFINKIAKMLAPGGIAIITMDFKEDQKDSDPIIGCNYRFYTTQYLLNKIIPSMSYCRLIDFYDWNKHPQDFVYSGYRYSFAALVFQKKIEVTDLDKYQHNMVENILQTQVKWQGIHQENQSSNQLLKFRLLSRLKLFVKKTINFLTK